MFFMLLLSFQGWRQIPEGKLGSSLHASIAGTIAAIDGESIVIQA